MESHIHPLDCNADNCSEAWNGEGQYPIANRATLILGLIIYTSAKFKATSGKPCAHISVEQTTEGIVAHEEQLRKASRTKYLFSARL